jgi:hypothetical protein
MLRGKEHTPTFYPSTVFTLDSVEFIKELGGASLMQTNHLLKNFKSLMKSLNFFKILGQHDFLGFKFF